MNRSNDGLAFAIKLMIVGILVVVMVIAALWASNAWLTVGQGHAALIVDARSHNITSVILGPSAGFSLDGFARMAGQQYPVDIYYATEVFEDTIPCFSSDQLEMNITVQMRWQLNTSKLIDLYRSYPRLDYESSAITSIMEKNIRFVTGNFTAVETIQDRTIVAQEMQTQVLQALQAEPSLQGALSYLTFDMKNIAYPENYTTAIEAKLATQQAELQAQFESERIQILANATAQQDILQAYGEAQAKVIIANSTKEAIDLILQSTGNQGNSTQIAELYLWVETLKQISPNVHTLIITAPNTSVLLPLDGSNSTSP
jgi:regulator of protease activity HflC (stomatin/prohibitin superfamily)